jgi:hypothetical protein
LYNSHSSFMHPSLLIAETTEMASSVTIVKYHHFHSKIVYSQHA